MVRRGFLVLLLALLASAPWAGADQGWSYGLWNDLMSPYCPGLTLGACGSGAACTCSSLSIHFSASAIQGEFRGGRMNARAAPSHGLSRIAGRQALSRA